MLSLECSLGIATSGLACSAVQLHVPSVLASIVPSMQLVCRGPGVVGETPVLKPGDVYEYTSACPLSTSTGSMKGEFEMIKVDKAGSEPQKFLAEVAQFSLDMQQARLA